MQAPLWDPDFVSAAHQRGIAVAGVICKEADARARLWMTNQPPPGTVYPVARYPQAMADAAMAGARWVVSLDQDLQRRIVAREPGAVRDGKEIPALADFLEANSEWRDWPSYGYLGLAQDPEQGALVSGGLLDRIAVQHTPVRPVSEATAKGRRVLVNLSGVRSAAPVQGKPGQGWRFPTASPEHFAIRKADLGKLEEIWRQVNEGAGRRNFGVRLFNGSSMLSHPVVSPEGQRLAIPMVHYTGYPVEGVTVHLLGLWKKARLRMPGREARDLHL